MANILFYVPFNQRSRDTETLMIAFHKQRHRVYCLSQQEGYQINDYLNRNGVTAVSHIVRGRRSGWWYYCRHLFFFVKFCWKHDIHIVYSHLEPANFVASIGQYFVAAKTYLCRHHVDEGKLYKFDRNASYRITYFFARQIIVVSKRAKEYMVSHERIPESKIKHINLAYDFSLYSKINPEVVKSIRQEHHADVLLLTACRLTRYKRPQLAIEVVKKLCDRGYDVKLVMLGKGEMLEELQEQIKAMNLEGRVCLGGYVDNVLEFMQAADYFIHPSILESSCVAVKEAGLAEVPPIVCKTIGDFEDYITDGENGFLVEADDFVERSVDLIIKYSNEKSLLKKIGGNLRQRVLELFNVENVVTRYTSLNRIS